jgi:predicted RNA binding protein YcfA (HicA-like mRNA interferase family)/predicted RNase H-like HicB family nuclease
LSQLLAANTKAYHPNVKVREVIKILENDGWYLARTKGSHRQFKHKDKPGAVTVSGKEGVDVPRGTLNSIWKQAGLKEQKGPGMKYAVIVEEGDTSFGAHVPDLPGCVAVAETRQEVLELIQEAIEFHLEGLRQDGQPIPPPSSSVEYVEIQAA